MSPNSMQDNQALPSGRKFGHDLDVQRDRIINFALWGAAAGLAIMLMAGPLLADPARHTLWLGLFVVGAVLMIVCLATAVTAAVTDKNERAALERRGKMLPLIGICACAIGFIGCTVWYFWLSPAVTSAPTTPVATLASPLMEAEARELLAVDKFVGQKTEDQLRSAFDIQGCLEWNIKRLRVIGLPSGAAKIREGQLVDQYFFGGKSIVNISAANASVGPNGLNLHPQPSEVAIINTSAAYNNALDKLTEYQNESILPEDVRYALVELHKNIDSNMALMITVLDAQSRFSHRNIMQNFQYGSPGYGRVSTAYWQQFALMRPRVDRISDAIRARMKVIDASRR